MPQRSTSSAIGTIGTPGGFDRNARSVIRIWLAFGVQLLLVVLSAAHAGGVGDLRQFLGQTKGLRANFDQVVYSADGKVLQEASGVMSLLRPGRFRWEMKKPFPQLIVGDGDRVWVYDQELKQVSVRPQGETLSASPAALLTGSGRLETYFELNEAGREAGLNWVLAIPKETDAGFESMRVGFEDGQLRQMHLVDSFGQRTHLDFTKLTRQTPSVDEFRFQPPQGVDVLSMP